jgi:hypothetical protein
MKHNWRTHVVALQNAVVVVLSTAAGVEVATDHLLLFGLALGAAACFDYAATVLWMGAYREEFFRKEASM